MLIGTRNCRTRSEISETKRLHGYPRQRRCAQQTRRPRWVHPDAGVVALLTEFVQDTFAAQKKLLSDATRDVFELQTKEKANKHKIDRLHDYEKQIDQLIVLQRLWCELLCVFGRLNLVDADIGKLTCKN